MSQKGFVHILLLILLLVGLAVGVYLVGQKTNLFPKAFVSQPTGPEVSFTLSSVTLGESNCDIKSMRCLLGPSRKDVQVGEEVSIELTARSDIDEANLFDAKLKFNPSLLEVTSIASSSGFINNWVEQTYDNSAGTVSLVGGVPSPGYKTTVGQAGGDMSKIIFRAKAAGHVSISFDNASAIYRNTDNQNILAIKRNFDFDITSGSSPTPTPSPTSSRVFVTSTLYNGNLGGLSGADAKCQTRADAASLGGTWKAWLSDDTDSAVSRLSHNTGPYVLIDNTRVANNWNDLVDGSLLADIKISELGTGVNDRGVFTNTKSNGEKEYSGDDNHCKNWTSASSSYGNHGGNTTLRSCSVDSSGHTVCVTWTTLYAAANCSYGVFSLYCFEQTSVSPTSSPPSTGIVPANKGDGNKDGKVNLIDMSVLFTWFNKTGNLPSIDMDDNGKINTFDFSLMRKQLIELKVIKGQ